MEEKSVAIRIEWKKLGGRSKYASPPGIGSNDFQDINEKIITFAEDFNFLFDQNLESAGGNPILKN